jgi:hypothetical protein
MFNASSMPTMLGALVGATAYAHAPSAALEPIPAQALANIHRARVEIYCGHNGLAVAVIRSASQQLRDSTCAVPPGTFAALDEAAWLARRDDYERAEQALDTALAHIAAPASSL